MAKNAALGKAKDAKQDEFYTQLALSRYRIVSHH